MKKLASHTLKEYIECLAKKQPAPGGGSVAALNAALAVGLLEMVTHYSIGKGKSKTIEGRFKKQVTKTKQLRKRLLELVDLDAKAYEGFVKARKKGKREQQKAARAAAAVPKEICQKCYQAMQLTSLLVEEGNENLISDLEIAVDMLVTAFNSALLLQEHNS